MSAEEELESLRLQVSRLRRSRTLLLHMLDEALHEQAELQARLAGRGVSNVRQLTPRAAQDKAPTP